MSAPVYYELLVLSARTPAAPQAMHYTPDGREKLNLGPLGSRDQAICDLLWSGWEPCGGPGYCFRRRWRRGRPVFIPFPPENEPADGGEGEPTPAPGETQDAD